MTNASLQPAYVLITPAHNEEDLLPRTIAGVVAQTHRPLCWVIVDDGSTDGTKTVVDSYARTYPFITVVDVRRSGHRNFGRKASAFMEGFRRIQHLQYDFIGNLDADIVLEPHYYQGILDKFADDPQLGIAGGIVYTKVGDRFLTSDTSPHSVGGAVQLFRSECFRAIGGYMSLEHGGIDAAAEIKARMLGWTVKKFLDFKVLEQRRTGSAEAKPVTARIREGKRFHSLGYELPYYLARAVYRLKDPPAIIGSLAAIYGYLRSYIRCEPVLLPPDVQQFFRREQHERLKGIWRDFCRCRPGNSSFS